MALAMLQSSKMFRFALPLTLGLFISAQAQAVNFQFLRHSLLSEFTKDELIDFKQAIRTALDNTEDHKEITWRSETSTLAGKFKAKFTYYNGDITCRRSLFLLGKDDKREALKFDICKVEGQWQIKDTPARHFNDSDWSLLKKSAEQALESSVNGQPLSWHNDATGHSGVNVVTARYRTKGNNCKNLAINIMDSSGNAANGNYTFCKKSGQWKRHITE